MTREHIRRRLNQVESALDALEPPNWEEYKGRMDETIQLNDMVRLPGNHECHDMTVSWMEMTWCLRAFRKKLREKLKEKERVTA